MPIQLLNFANNYIDIDNANCYDNTIILNLLIDLPWLSIADILAKTDNVDVAITFFIYLLTCIL